MRLAIVYASGTSISTAPAIPNIDPTPLPAKRGARWTRKPSQASSKTQTTPPTIMPSRAFMATRLTRQRS